VNDALRDALRRNALLSGVMDEGYLPSKDSSLRARLRSAMLQAVRRRRLRRSLLAAAAAAGILALTMAPLERPPVAAPAAIVTRPESFLVVTTAAAAPVFEVVPTPSISAFEVVRTAQLIGPLERIRDEELLASGEVVGIVGHPGGVRRLILVSPAPHRNLE